MGMSTHMTLLRDSRSQQHIRMVEALRALVEAGISVMPMEMEKYFNTTDIGEAANDPERAIAVACYSLNAFIPDKARHDGVYSYEAEMRAGFDIRIDDLPDDVKVLRVYNMY